MSFKDFSTALIEVCNIRSHRNRLEFDAANLEEYAQSILNLGGIISPIIVRRQGSEFYEIIQGDFEYYAAVRATEINDDLEMIRAFIVTSDTEAEVLKQVRLGHKISDHSENRDHDIVVSPDQLNNLSGSVDQLRQDTQSSLKDLTNHLQGLEALMQAKAFPSVLEMLNQIPQSKLVVILSSANVIGKRNEKILKLILDERQRQPFQSLQDLVDRVPGFSAATLIKLVDAAERIFN